MSNHEMHPAGSPADYEQQFARALVAFETPGFELYASKIAWLMYKVLQDAKVKNPDLFSKALDIYLLEGLKKTIKCWLLEHPNNVDPRHSQSPDSMMEEVMDHLVLVSVSGGVDLGAAAAAKITEGTKDRIEKLQSTSDDTIRE